MRQSVKGSYIYAWGKSKGGVRLQEDTERIAGRWYKGGYACNRFGMRRRDTVKCVLWREARLHPSPGLFVHREIQIDGGSNEDEGDIYIGIVLCSGLCR
jgi:hypothetical protein